MKKSSIVAAVFVISILSSCIGTLSTRSANFRVINCTSTQWTAGTPGGGAGTDYALYLGLKGKEKPVFDSVWIDGEVALCESNLMKKDLLEIRSTIMDVPPRNRPGFKPAQAPVAFAGKSLFRYTVKGEVHYLVVKEYTKLKPVNLP